MRRHLTTLTLALAGLSWTVGQAVLPDLGLETGERYDRVADAPGLESLSGALFFCAGALLVLGAMVAATRLALASPGRGGRLMRTGTALVGLGGIWLVGGRGAFNLMFVRLVESDSLSRADAIDLLDSAGGPGFIPLLLTLPCLLLGPVLLSVGLKRAGYTGWWPLAAWVVGIGVFVGTEFQIKAGEVAGIGLASVGLLLIGAAIDAAGKPGAARHVDLATMEHAGRA